MAQRLALCDTSGYATSACSKDTTISSAWIAGQPTHKSTVRHDATDTILACAHGADQTRARGYTEEDANPYPPRPTRRRGLSVRDNPSKGAEHEQGTKEHQNSMGQSL